MRYCRKLLRSFLFGALLLIFAQTVLATDLTVRNPQLVADEDGYALSADFNINFNSRLEEAVNKGVVLYFSIDFELSRSRWYWFDEQVIRRNRTYELSYHALTRQYHLSTGALHQSYASLEEVLRLISRLRNWQVLEKGQYKNDQMYLARLRMYLDLTQMPKTFQVSALANKDWNLNSDWARWSFTPTEVALAVPPSPASSNAVTPPNEPVTPTTGESK